MRIPRVYLPQTLQSNTQVELDDRAKHHILTVLRLKVGSELIIFNGQGGEYNAKILAAGKKPIAEIIGFNDVNRESTLNTHLVQGISRGDRMDITIQKAVELGVQSITPVFTKRSVPQYDEKRIQKRMLHWQGIIINACEQSGRCTIPTLNSPIELSEWLNSSQKHNETRLILNPLAENTHSIKTQPLSSYVSLLIGPEGGFEEQEITNAISKEHISLRLGPRILRTETAAITILAILQGLHGDLN